VADKILRGASGEEMNREQAIKGSDRKKKVTPAERPLLTTVRSKRRVERDRNQYRACEKPKKKKNRGPPGESTILECTVRVGPTTEYGCLHRGGTFEGAP